MHIGPTQTSHISRKGFLGTGWQRECLLSEDEMHEKSFEAIKQLSSSRGGLYIIKNWDKIIWHPNFVYQSVLKDLYRVSISKNTLEKVIRKVIVFLTLFYRNIQSIQLGYIQS